MFLYSKPIFKISSLLYNRNFSLYQKLYFLYKNRQDRLEMELLAKLVKSGDTVVDIGANIGFYSLYLAKLVGKKGQVHSFEPEKNNFSHLKQLTKRHKNIKIWQIAVSNNNQPITLYTSDTINVDHKTYKTDHYQQSYKVKSTTLDSYLKGRSVHLIKMDIQGAEYFALKGMRKTLSKNKDIILLMEYWPLGMHSLNIPIQRMEKFFQELGLTIYYLEDGKMHRLTKQRKEKYNLYQNYDFDNWLVTAKPISNKNLLG